MGSGISVLKGKSAAGFSWLERKGEHGTDPSFRFSEFLFDGSLVHTEINLLSCFEAQENVIWTQMDFH